MSSIRSYWVTIAAIALLLSVLVIIFSGCEGASSSKTTQSIIAEVQKEPVTEAVYGNYFLFETTDKQEYLNFLEKFDVQKYEIIDISTSMYRTQLSSEFYMVTYKVKEIEAS